MTTKTKIFMASFSPVFRASSGGIHALEQNGILPVNRVSVFSFAHYLKHCLKKRRTACHC